MFWNRKLDRMIDLKRRRLLRISQMIDKLNEVKAAKLARGWNVESIDLRINKLISKAIYLKELLDDLKIKNG